MNESHDKLSSRREFIKTSSTLTAAAVAAPYILVPEKTFAANSDTLKVGLIGCGGRGRGAAKQALSADKNAILVAIADPFADQIEAGIAALKGEAEIAERVQVTPEKQFTGLDAYQKLLASGVDVVLLASPPVFRAEHMKAAVAANKHIFCEKPVCVDAIGYHAFLDAVNESKKKKLVVVAGFCWRSHPAQRAVYKKILDGEIGDVRSIYGTYNTGFVREPKTNPAWGPLETQMRNWIHYNWLSGDHLVEQAIHNVDLMNWAMHNKMPLKAIGHGGSQVHSDNWVGNNFDHFSIVYEFENGVKGFLFCRQQAGCANDNSETIWGTKGTARVPLFGGAPFITDSQNQRLWRYEGENADMYQVEHNEFFAAIRAGTERNDGEWLANSSMMGIMGRMAAYTGKEITWEQAISSKLKMAPDKLDWNVAPPVLPIAMPGQTQFV